MLFVILHAVIQGKFLNGSSFADFYKSDEVVMHSPGVVAIRAR